MTPWSSRSIIACLVLLSACPAEPEPQPAEESSTGPSDTTTTTGPGPGTMPQPTTLDSSSSSSSGVDDTSSTSSTGPDDTSSTSSTGPDDTSSSSSSSTGDDTTSSSSSGESTSGSSSSSESSSSSTTGPDPCDAGDGPDFAVTNNGFTDYVINGVNDPPLTVVRGCSYTFNINAAGHPFLIKTVQGSGVGNQYNDGVVGNGTQNGAITWEVAMDAPDGLFYNCQFHPGMTNAITVIDPM